MRGTRRGVVAFKTAAAVFGCSALSPLVIAGTTQLKAVGCATDSSCIAVGSNSSGKGVLVQFELPLR